MPAKNSIKLYIENGYYHLYNRGVDKRFIFRDSQDYEVFLSLLKKYLDPTLGSDRKSLVGQVELLSFCLMPNHFHLLVKQFTLDGITRLIRAVTTSYVMYFNEKYNRSGTLFQGKYKGVLILEDSYLLHLTRYIHLNPAPGSDPRYYEYSSYNYYIGNKSAYWLKIDEILSYFKSARSISLKDCLSYQSFVEDYAADSKEILGELILEDGSEGSDPLIEAKRNYQRSV